MTTSTENDRVKTLISDTLTLLCKNGLQFKSEFSIAATIGITLDKTNVILVSINDIVHTESSVDERENGADTDKKSLHDEESLKRKRRKIKQRKRTPSISDAEDEQTYPMDEDIVLVKTEEPEDEQTWPVDNGGDADYQDNVLLQGSSQVSSHPLTGSQLNPDDACFEDGSMQLTAVDPTSSESQDIANHWTSFSSRDSRRREPSFVNFSGTDLRSQSNVCFFCKEVFITVEELINHRATYHADKSQYTHFCPYCGKAYTCGSNLKGHIHTHHSNQKPFRCIFCDSHFGYKHHLQRHINNIHMGASVPKELSKS